MNILLTILSIFFFIVAFATIAQAIENGSTSMKKELVPIMASVILFAMFLTMYVSLYYFMKYDVDVEYVDDSNFIEVSQTTDGNTRTTIEQKHNKCKVFYVFNRELILFDKGGIRVDYNSSCKNLSDDDKVKIENKRLTYVRELNEH